MKNKTKFLRFLSCLISAIIIVSTLAISASAGLVNSNDSNYVQVSASTGKSVSVPLYDETPPLSHALNIIRNNFELKKNALLNSDVTFKPEEFEKILGIKKLQSVTITKLPDYSEGILTLGGNDILEGQTISRENIQYIRLIPYPNRVGEISFSFKNGADTTKYASMQCTVAMLETLNFAPSASSVSLTTQKNIATFKSMDGSDPDGDELFYQITQAPKKGLLEVIDASTGNFIYRPGKNFTGNDSFEYQITDKYGNVSNTAKAEIKVTKAASDVIFADMTDHWAANSAIKAVGAGFIDANKNDPDLMFEPDTLLTRAEFVEMIIRAAKLDKNMSEVYKTKFADDADIPVKFKPYVTKAYELGIIKGIPTDTGVYFDPNSMITRAEAAVILNNILNIKPDGSASLKNRAFVDAVLIPEWAEDDIAALNSVGIIKGNQNGNINPSGLLSKAQSVEMLCAMIDYTDSQKKSGGFLSFLFG